MMFTLAFTIHWLEPEILPASVIVLRRLGFETLLLNAPASAAKRSPAVQTFQLDCAAAGRAAPETATRQMTKAGMLRVMNLMVESTVYGERRLRRLNQPPQARPARAITQVEGSGTGVMITEKISGDAVLSNRELVLGTLETIPPKM